MRSDFSLNLNTSDGSTIWASGSPSCPSSQTGARETGSRKGKGRGRGDAKTCSLSSQDSNMGATATSAAAGRGLVLHSVGRDLRCEAALVERLGTLVCEGALIEVVDVHKEVRFKFEYGCFIRWIWPVAECSCDCVFFVEG